MDDLNSQTTILSSAWLILGIIIFLGNALTTRIIWLRKCIQEMSKFGLKCHAAYNLLVVNISYSFQGLILILISIVRLTKDGRISEGACDVLGFFQAFSFHIVAVGVLVLQANKFYGITKPFSYYSYSQRKSIVPLIAAISCIIYGTIIAVLPLTKLGNYSSKSSYISCMLRWNQNGAFYVGLFLNIVLFLLTIVVISVTLRLKLKLIQKRRKMRVATSRPNETIIFVLAVSSLFALCWSPNLIAMLVFLGEEQPPEEKTKAVLFGITLIPVLFNPVLTFSLCDDCRVELIKYWSYIKECFTPKKIQKTAGACEVRTPSVVAIEAIKM